MIAAIRVTHVEEMVDIVRYRVYRYHAYTQLSISMFVVYVIGIQLDVPKNLL